MLYVFDEATGNLDVNFREDLYRQIRELVSTGEKSVIYATHLVEELEEFADYILWLQKKENVGYARFFGTTDDLKNQYRMVEADSSTLDYFFRTIYRSAANFCDGNAKFLFVEFPGALFAAPNRAGDSEAKYYECHDDLSGDGGLYVVVDDSVQFAI